MEGYLFKRKSSNGKIAILFRNRLRKNVSIFSLLVSMYKNLNKCLLFKKKIESNKKSGSIDIKVQFINFLKNSTNLFIIHKHTFHDSLSFAKKIIYGTIITHTQKKNLKKNTL